MLTKQMCLNPCSNGIPSDRFYCAIIKHRVSLNPCSNGIPSDSLDGEWQFGINGLNPCSNGIPSDFTNVTLFELYKTS